MTTLKELLTSIVQALLFTAHAVLAGFGFTLGVLVAIRLLRS
jgi:hypothetical protein